jgi:CheY-like chemotaxis protein
MTAPDALSGMKALIVDDNATNRRILQVMLRAWGLITGEAEGGEQALSELLSARTNGKTVSLDSDRHAHANHGWFHPSRANPEHRRNCHPWRS